MTGSALETATAKVYRRLLPFLIVCYFVAYLDRVNVGFAALTMNADLGIGPETFGFIAGIFFAGYALFEVPSNVILARVGARTWIARIMITWGLVSIAMAFVTGATSLGFARFLLGVAEAGFFPGIIYYLTRWIPAAGRAGLISAFMAAVPVSAVIGAPLSGLILDQAAGFMGLKGWQWLFILEAIPAIVLGIAVYFVLPDRPKDASWLSPDESTALSDAIAAEDHSKAHTRAFTVREALTDARVLALSLVYFGLATGLYSLTFWIPQIVKAFGGLSNTQSGLLSAVPFLLGSIAMVLWGRHSDRKGERVWHIAIAALLGGAGMIAGALVSEPAAALAALSVAAIGVFCALPTFWTLPAAHLSGAAAAGGIALINAIGNAGGFAGPYVIGWLKGAGFSSGAAVASIASVMIVSGVVVVMVGEGREK
jgi:MFS transporter, ACS family, tartrate transporter